MKKTKLQKILNALSPDVAPVDFADFDKQVSSLKSNLKEKVRASALNDVNRELERFRKKIDLTQTLDALDKIKQEYIAKYEKFWNTVNQELNSVGGALTSVTTDQTELRGDIGTVQSKLDELATAQTRWEKEFKTIREEIETLNLGVSPSEVDEKIAAVTKKLLDLIKELKDENAKALNDLRLDILSRIPQGGGNANRQITIGNNPSVLGKYTDINLIAGSNVTISYSNNNTTKRVDVTLAATGGSGTTRSINSISTNTAAGDTAGTDYVYICTDALTLTLPTAVGNENLYTIKNVSTSSVLVGTTGGETIDTETSLILSTRFTAIDLISDSANWNIT